MARANARRVARGRRDGFSAAASNERTLAQPSRLAYDSSFKRARRAFASARETPTRELNSESSIASGPWQTIVDGVRDDRQLVLRQFDNRGVIATLTQRSAAEPELLVDACCHQHLSKRLPRR